ncbi:hypothetical protein Syun_002941 [Stephania yunnanensis]|uniref:Uncharacterized protein n=1 Tax=Stephania yunnanensis TaxID=152371 RepID=A0AAP0Q157_9MAGN
MCILFLLVHHRYNALIMEAKLSKSNCYYNTLLKKPFREQLVQQTWRNQVHQNQYGVVVCVQSIVTRMGPISKDMLYCTTARERSQNSLNTLNMHVTRKITALTTSHHSLITCCPSYYQAKTTGYFLVLVPLIAFCIRCIIVAIQHRTEGDSKRRRGLNKSKSHHYESRNMRWKSALSDIREPELVNAASKHDSNENVIGEEEPSEPFEEISDSFTKLEPEYQKFLAECGMSSRGYWRGGGSE